MTGRTGSRWHWATVACALAAGAVVADTSTTTVTAQAPAKSATRAAAAVERTPDGKPDLQGVWANNTVTPLERPKHWEGKATLTDAEVAELQRVAQQIYDNDGDAQFGDGLILAVLDKITKPGSYDPGTGNYNQFWIVGRDWHDRRTSLITDPPNGKLPALTPAAQTRVAAMMARLKEHAFEDPETFPLGERCVHFGLGQRRRLLAAKKAGHLWRRFDRVKHIVRDLPFFVALDLDQDIARIEHARRFDPLIAAHFNDGLLRQQHLGYLLA